MSMPWQLQNILAVSIPEGDNACQEPEQYDVTSMRKLHIDQTCNRKTPDPSTIAIRYTNAFL